MAGSNCGALGSRSRQPDRQPDDVTLYLDAEFARVGVTLDFLNRACITPNSESHLPGKRDRLKRPERKFGALNCRRSGYVISTTWGSCTPDSAAAITNHSTI